MLRSSGVGVMVFSSGVNKRRLRCIRRLCRVTLSEPSRQFVFIVPSLFCSIGSGFR